MSRYTSSIGRDYFNALYGDDPDPWRFGTSEYERDKYAASLDALPDPFYESALEVGCSIGIFTRLLASRCRHLLALDVAEQALAQARQNCPLAHVTFENRSVPRDWPEGQFDLIVLSEVLYYLDRPALQQAALLARESLRPGGVILLVHYLGETNYPLTGDEAATFFIEAVSMPLLSQSRTDAYRLDTLKS
jgi:SAM-dependent methyltransferase